MLRICPYSVRLRENKDQNNSEYGHFLCSGTNTKRHFFLYVIFTLNFQMFLFRLHISKLNSIIKPQRRVLSSLLSWFMTCFCQVSIETLNKEFPIHFPEEPEICSLSSNTTRVFLRILTGIKHPKIKLHYLRKI